MKRGLLIGLLLGIFLINFASAQFLNIGYGNYFDDSMIVYGLIFVIFFAFISFALGRTVFKENKGTNAVASLAIAGLAVWGLTKTNINVGGFHVGNLYIGDYAPTIFTILLIGLLIYSIYRRVFANVLIGLGLFLIIISFTGLVYEKNIILILGIILLIIGLLLRFRFTGRWNIGGAGGGGRAPPGRVTLIIRVQGNGRTNPSQGIHTPRENRNIRINATPAPGNAFRYWIVNGNQFTRRSMRLRMDRNYDCTAVFSGGGVGGGASRK